MVVLNGDDKTHVWLQGSEDQGLALGHEKVGAVFLLFSSKSFSRIYQEIWKHLEIIKKYSFVRVAILGQHRGYIKIASCEEGFIWVGQFQLMGALK